MNMLAIFVQRYCNHPFGAEILLPSLVWTCSRILGLTPTLRVLSNIESTVAKHAKKEGGIPDNSDQVIPTKSRTQNCTEYFVGTNMEARSNIQAKTLTRGPLLVSNHTSLSFSSTSLGGFMSITSTSHGYTKESSR